MARDDRDRDVRPDDETPGTPPEFAERGYAGARVAEIAKRAGVTTGAIYSRYRGKAELLSEAIDAATSGEFDELFTDHRFSGRMEDILRIAGSHLIDRCPPEERRLTHGPGLLLESFTAARQCFVTVNGFSGSSTRANTRPFASPLQLLR